MMRISLFLSFLLALFTTLPAEAADQEDSFRGWTFLVERLKADGLPSNLVEKTYSDRRMPRYTPIPFTLKPRESMNMYQTFHKQKTLRIAEEFLEKHKDSFTHAEETFGVNRFIIAAIILVETKGGQYLGSHLVLHRLSRLAAIATPTNIEYNYKRLKKEDAKVTLAEVQERAQYLDETFYPELPALFRLTEMLNLDLLELKGSRAGAFGIPQFLPTTFHRFATDCNKDNQVSLFSFQDSVCSVANFLSSFGWQEDLSSEEQVKVVWRYNHSEAYVATVLAIAEQLGKDSRMSKLRKKKKKNGGIS